MRLSQHRLDLIGNCCGGLGIVNRLSAAAELSQPVWRRSADVAHPMRRGVGMSDRSGPHQVKSSPVGQTAQHPPIPHLTTQTLHDDAEQVHRRLMNLQIDAGKHFVKSLDKNKT
jgi:hypothetical protein